MRACIIPLLLVDACSDPENGESKKGATIVNLKTMPRRKEPESISVDHILISFLPVIATAGRSQDEAEALAYDLLDQLAKGADWNTLKAKYSDDPGPSGTGGGPYSMVNSMRRGRGMRGDMVPAFGNVGFQLLVGEIAIADYDAIKSRHGWHIIKRVE